MFFKDIYLIQLFLNTILLFFIAIEDIKKRKISNTRIISFYIVNIFFLILNFDISKVLVDTLCLFFVIFLLLILYTKTDKIGAGDIKLFVGIMISYYFPYSVLLCVLSVVFALIFMFIKKCIHKKKVLTIPLAPFIFTIHLIITCLRIINKLIIVN